MLLEDFQQLFVDYQPEREFPEALITAYLQFLKPIMAEYGHNSGNLTKSPTPCPTRSAKVTPA